MSQFQDSVRTALEAAFPGARIREGVGVKWEGQQLFLDFWIPHLSLVFEADGTQHDTYSEFFHGSASGFRLAQKRDARKEEWAVAHGQRLVRIPWRDRSAVSAEYIWLRIREGQDG